MEYKIKIGIIGDFNPGSKSHALTIDAIGHASSALSLTVDISWIPSYSLGDEDDIVKLSAYNGLWGAPGDYTDPEGALRAITFAREQEKPFIGT